MTMTDEIKVNETPIFLEDLEVIRAALNAAYMKNYADDLSDQYRKLSNRQQKSALTRALEGALGRTEAYIAEINGEEEEDDA